MNETMAKTSTPTTTHRTRTRLIRHGAGLSALPLIAAVALAPSATAAPADDEPAEDTEVVRLGGEDRYETAVELAGWFGQDVDTVYITTGEEYPDGLAAGSVAAKAADSTTNEPGPVLLVKPDEIPSATADALERLEPRNISVVGGVDAVQPDTLNALAQYSELPPKRYGGGNRYETAAQFSDWWAPGDIVFVATGEDFPDALSSAARAGTMGHPLLLVKEDGIPSATAAALDELDPSSISLVGGETAINGEVEDALAEWAPTYRLAGDPADGRYGTAAVVHGDSPPGEFRYLFVGSGQDWPDAITGSAAAGSQNSPLLLTQKERLPWVTAELTGALAGDVDFVYVLGSDDAVSDTVVEQLTEAINR